MTTLTLTPAYGRDYKNKKEVLADYKNGKDFIYAPTGQYCSNRDFLPHQTVMLRYDKLKKITQAK